MPYQGPAELVTGHLCGLDERVTSKSPCGQTTHGGLGARPDSEASGLPELLQVMETPEPPQSSNIGQVILFTWIDSTSVGGWHELTTDGLSHISSCGFLVHLGANHMVVAGSLGSTGRLGDQLCVPFAAITEWQTIREEKVRQLDFVK